MKRTTLPEKAFAAVLGDNRLLLHHTSEVKDGNAHATVDITRLVLCLSLIDQLPEEIKESAEAHLMEHACAIAGTTDKAEARSFMEKIRIEQNLHVFSASMTTIQEQPPIFGPAKGTAKFLYNGISGDLFYSVEFSELSATETAAHLHRGDSGTRTDEAEIIVPLELGAVKEGRLQLNDEQGKMLMEGGLLINIHSSEYPLGEIRGQLLPVVPDSRVNSSHERVGSGNPQQGRDLLPEEGEGAPVVNAGGSGGDKTLTSDESIVRTAEAGDTQTDLKDKVTPKAGAQKDKPEEVEAGQEDKKPKSDISAKPAAEPKTGVEAGQEDLQPVSLTDERPQKEPGQGGGSGAKDSTEEPGQETKNPTGSGDIAVPVAEPGSVESKKKNPFVKDDDKEKDKEDDEDVAKSNEDGTFAAILEQVSKTTSAIGNRFRRRSVEKEQKRLGKPSPSALATQVLSANAHFDGPEGGTPLMVGNLTDPNNSILKLELELLDTPEKLKSFATPTAKQQEDRQNVVLTASFQMVGDKVVMMDGDFVDPKVEEAHKMLPRVSNSLFEGGKFLGMKAKLKEIVKRGTTERVTLVLESEEDGFTMGLWIDIHRDAEGAIQELMMLDSFVPAEFLKDFAGFLSGLT